MATLEPEPEMTPEPNPEPLPDWETSFEIWSWWWELHNFGLGFIFFIFAIFSTFCLIRLRSLQKLTLGRYFTAVSALLLVFTSSRALYLVIDPYEGHRYITLPVVVDRVLFALGYPCLTSVFSLINFAFVKVNNLSIIIKKLQNIKFLSAVIFGHFILVLVIYLVVTFSPQFAQLFIICQSIFILWWLVLVVFFLYSAWLAVWNKKINTKYINRRSKIYELSSFNARETCSESNEPERHENESNGTQKIVRISTVVAIAGLISVALELYSLFGVYNLYSLKGKFVKPWPWWGYQTASRVAEVCLCCIVAYIIYPTLKRRRNHDSSDYINTRTRTTNQMRKITVEVANEPHINSSA